MIYKFFTCDVCQLLKNIDDGLDRCRKCGILQCNDCEIITINGTTLTLTCVNCHGFMGTGTADFMSDEDREKLK